MGVGKWKWKWQMATSIDKENLHTVCITLHSHPSLNVCVCGYFCMCMRRERIWRKRYGIWQQPLGKIKYKHIPDKLLLNVIEKHGGG